MQLPNFIIIGASKCGTTSMYNCLLQHPNILPNLGNEEDTLTTDGEMLGEKEIRFFDKYYWKGWDWYRSRFPKCNKDFITGEASPTYFHKTLSISRIAEFMPNCKVIIMLRDPADRLISHYFHLKSILKSWEQRYPTLEKYWNSANERDYYPIEYGMYDKHLQMVYYHFARKNIHIIKSENFFQTPNEVYLELLNFLEVEQIDLKKVPHLRKGSYNKIDEGIRREIQYFYKVNDDTLIRTINNQI